MTYKVKRLTRQYNGYGSFKYLIQPTLFNQNTTRQQLAKWREWCWETWGPSRELLWAMTETPGVTWAWDTEHDNKRIYLKDDAELVLFQLKF